MADEDVKAIYNKLRANNPEMPAQEAFKEAKRLAKVSSNDKIPPKVIDRDPKLKNVKPKVAEVAVAATAVEGNPEGIAAAAKLAGDAKANKDKIKADKKAAKAKTKAGYVAGGAAAGYAAGGWGSKGRSSVELHQAGFVWVVLAIVLYLTDWFFTKFNGFNYRVFMGLFDGVGLLELSRIFLSAGPIAIAFAYAIIKKPKNMREFISFFVMIEFFWLIITMAGFSSADFGTTLHVLFGIFAAIFLFPSAYEDKSQAHYLTIILVALDFFFFSYIAEFSTNLPYFNRLTVPIWFFATLYFTKDSDMKKFVTVIVTLIYVFFAFNTTLAYSRGGMDALDQGQIENAKDFFVTSFGGMKDFVVGVFTRQANETLGEYYTGQIDSNAQERLGVYIEQLKFAGKGDFQEDQPVVIWGTLIAKTLDKQIDVHVECKADDDEVEDVKIYPQEEFNIMGYEEEAVECSYQPGALKEGSHEVSLHADFNFLTLAYLKTYFMDQETRRSLIREDIDPLVHYGIIDKAPTAQNTAGPVVIGMDVGSPPLATDREFRLGITITNIWEGKLQEVTNLYIITPEEIDMKKESDGFSYCRGKRQYKIEQSSCSDVEEDDQGCDDNIHNVYKMDLEEQGIDAIQEYETILCRMEVGDSTGLLSGAPITTKYFKVAVEYDYSIFKKLGVNVKGGDGVRDILSDGQCDRECTDKDGCLCPNGCEIARNEEISEGATCGGDKEEETSGFVEEESGCNADEWKNICPCQSGNDGIYCFNDKWVCTTDANQNDATYHSLEEC